MDTKDEITPVSEEAQHHNPLTYSIWPLYATSVGDERDVLKFIDNAFNTLIVLSLPTSLYFEQYLIAGGIVIMAIGLKGGVLYAHFGNQVVENITD